MHMVVAYVLFYGDLKSRAIKYRPEMIRLAIIILTNSVFFLSSAIYSNFESTAGAALVSFFWSCDIFLFCRVNDLFRRMFRTNNRSLSLSALNSANSRSTSKLDVCSTSAAGDREEGGDRNNDELMSHHRRGSSRPSIALGAMKDPKGGSAAAAAAVPYALVRKSSIANSQVRK